MTRYVAFLRGINLGNRRIRNDELGARFETLDGIERVDTFLASGNVIFDAAGGAGELESEIEGHLADTLGYEVDTFVRALGELESMAERDLFPESGGAGWKEHVMFLKQPAGDGAEERLNELATADDRFRVAGTEAYWLRRGGLSDSTLMPADLERAVGADTSTMRTLNTVRRIVKKFAGDDG